MPCRCLEGATAYPSSAAPSWGGPFHPPLPTRAPSESKNNCGRQAGSPPARAASSRIGKASGNPVHPGSTGIPNRAVNTSSPSASASAQARLTGSTRTSRLRAMWATSLSDSQDDVTYEVAGAERSLPRSTSRLGSLRLGRNIRRRGTGAGSGCRAYIGVRVGLLAPGGFLVVLITESDGRDVKWRPPAVTCRASFVTETTVSAFDLTDTDVQEALDWTRSEAGDRGWRLSVPVPLGAGR